MGALIILLSTGCYAGYTPRAPGTAGSVLGVGLVWVLAGPLGLTLPYYLLATAVLFVLGVWVSSHAEPRFGHDGPEIVIDEIADIWKPFPCDRMQRLPAGLGVMMDDAVAAVYAHLLLLLIGWLVI